MYTPVKARLAFMLLLISTIASAKESDALSVTPLPALTSVSAWRAPADTNALKLTSSDDTLAVEMRFAKNQAERLMLNDARPIKAGEELTFTVAPEDCGKQPLWVNVLARDAQGREYLFYTKSNGSLGIFSETRGLYLGGAFRPGLEPIAQSRFTAPGLKTLQTGTFEPVKPGDARPVAPLTLLGLQIKRKDEGEDRTFHIYLSRFALSRLAPTASTLRYQFDDEERFGELDGSPSLIIGNLGAWSGRTFNVTWDIRDRYDGQPFVAGHQDFDLDPTEKSMPYALQRCRGIELPVRQEGTYWVHVRLGWSNEDGAPNTFIEHDYRLYVIHGKPAVTRTALPASSPAGGSAIRFAPARASMVWSAAEAFQVPITITTTGGPGAAGPQTYRIRVLTAGGQSVLPELNGPLTKGPGRAQSISANLSSLPPGAYQVEASVLSGGKVVDRMTRLVGKQPTPPSAGSAPVIPADVPSHSQIIEGDKPLFHLSPMLDNLPIDEQHTRAGYMKQFMDKASAISRDTEYQVLWRTAEPLPGVYDFTEVDKVLNSAKEKGFAVMLWPVLHDSPEWLPSMYTENEKGEIFGQNLYLFHGARLNLIQANPLREAALRFIRALVVHTRGQSAVQGYFVLLEQTGDAAYAGWYEGYDASTAANFRSAMQKQYANVAALNRAWGTTFRDFAAVVAPRHEGPASSNKCWLDWMQFQSGALHDFLVECAKTVRAEDPKRLILVYDDGLVPDRLGEFRALGCMTANGGCDDPQRGTPNYIRVAAAGVPQRAEEVSVGQWSARSPTQLDASMFSMLTGGGGNANCKMYVDVRQSMNNGEIDLNLMRKPPYSLDRYERLMPVWTELRRTEALPRDICYFEDFNSYLVEKKTTYYGWLADPWGVASLFDSHLLFGTVPGTPMNSAKLLLMLHSNLDVLQRSRIDELAKYVQDGGVLMMRADAGRRCVESPAEDWALLRRFGFKPPQGVRTDEQYVTATPTPKGILAIDTHPFVLREFWDSGTSQPGQTDATFDNAPRHAAVSSVKFGRGRVVVVWASTVVPRGVGGRPDGALLRSVARSAKAALPVDSDVPRFWLNLLKDKSADTYYGLVYCNVFSNPLTEPTQSGSVRYDVPDGDYEVNELISRASIGRRSAAQLRDQGLNASLPANAVAVYKMRRLP